MHYALLGSLRDILLVGDANATQQRRDRVEAADVGRQQGDHLSALAAWLACEVQTLPAAHWVAHQRGISVAASLALLVGLRHTADLVDVNTVSLDLPLPERLRSVVEATGWRVHDDRRSPWLVSPSSSRMLPALPPPPQGALSTVHQHTLPRCVLRLLSNCEVELHAAKAKMNAVWVYGNGASDCSLNVPDALRSVYSTNETLTGFAAAAGLAHHAPLTVAVDLPQRALLDLQAWPATASAALLDAWFDQGMSIDCVFADGWRLIHKPRQRWWQ